jgi:hypothetical protein
MPPIDSLADRLELAEEDILRLKKRLNTVYRFLLERAEKDKEEEKKTE